MQNPSTGARRRRGWASSAQFTKKPGLIDDKMMPLCHHSRAAELFSNFFSTNPKVPARRSVKEEDKAEWALKKYFQKTLKFPKSLTLIESDAQQTASGPPQNSSLQFSFPPRFHRGATMIRQGLSDKLLRVHFVFAGRKIQKPAYTAKVSAQSECIPLAIQNNARFKRINGEWK